MNLGEFKIYARRFVSSGGVTWGTIAGTLSNQTDLQTAIDAKVSDTAYAASWNGVTTIAPSKNAVYDKIQSLSQDVGLSPFLLMGG